MPPDTQASSSPTKREPSQSIQEGFHLHRKRSPGSFFSSASPEYCLQPATTHHPNCLTSQSAAYPTPNPNGNMVHGRHKGVSLNFQAKIPTERMPNIMPMILGSMWFLFPIDVRQKRRLIMPVKMPWYALDGKKKGKTRIWLLESCLRGTFFIIMVCRYGQKHSSCSYGPQCTS